jgi:hypothetical protein
MKTEWVVTYQNLDSIQKGMGYVTEIKIAYRTAEFMAAGLSEQTKEGWAAVKVIERPRKTYAD